MEKEDKRLGGLAWKYVDLLVEFSKGRVVREDAAGFFNMFFNPPFPGGPTSTDEVIEKLRAAWWVEEEDIRQQCYAYLLSRKTHEKATVVHMTFMLFKWLRWNQKVFSRQSGWEERYNTGCPTTYEMPLPSQTGLDILLKENTSLSLYDRYLIYYIVLGYSIHSISTLTNQERMQLAAEIKRLGKQFKEDIWIA